MMQPHHQAWLEAHPDKDEEWLRSMLKHGFDVHHIDGRHWNNEPENLILVEGGDHKTKIHLMPLSLIAKIRKEELPEPPIDQAEEYVPMSSASILALRHKLDLSQSEFSTKLGIGRRTLGQYEMNQSPVPKPVALACAAIAFELPPME